MKNKIQTGNQNLKPICILNNEASIQIYLKNSFYICFKMEINKDRRFKYLVQLFKSSP